MTKETFPEKCFVVLNYMFMILLALICILPIVHVWAISLSSNHAISSNLVYFLPVGLEWNAYRMTLSNTAFYDALWITVQRTALSTVLGLSVTGLAAYVLAKGGGRDGIAGYFFFVGYFLVAMLFTGGLIPTYMVVTGLGLANSIWALVLPGVTNIFYLILMMNFFKALPKELEDSAFMDGASHWTVFTKIIVPLSKPVIVVIGLFIIVWEWNAWFDGMIYMQGSNVPLSTYLRSVIASPEMLMDSNILSEIVATNNRALRSAQILVGAAPIIIMFPFLMKYFTKGIVIGAVKE